MIQIDLPFEDSDFGNTSEKTSDLHQIQSERHVDVVPERWKGGRESILIVRVSKCGPIPLRGLTFPSTSTGWSTCRNHFTVRHRSLQHVVVTGRGRPGCRLVQPSGILGSNFWARCCTARAKLFCRSSYQAMASEFVVEHSLCRLCAMSTVVGTVHRPVRTIYACTTTPLSSPSSWNTPRQLSYNGGGELGTIKHFSDNLLRRPRGLPPDQQNYHLDPSRLLNSLRVRVRRGDATQHCPPFGGKIRIVFRTLTVATPFLDGAPDIRRQYTVFDHPTT